MNDKPEEKVKALGSKAKHTFGKKKGEKIKDKIQKDVRDK